MRRVLGFGRRKSILAAIFVLFTLTPLAWAQLLDGSALRESLFEQTLEGEYTSGAGWRETFNRDGTSQYTDNTGSVSGTMTIKGQHLCFNYTGYSHLSGGCFEVWQRGQKCFDFYGIGDSGNTAANETQKFRGLAWDARGWVLGGDKSDCVADLIS